MDLNIFTIGLNNFTYYNVIVRLGMVLGEREEMRKENHNVGMLLLLLKYHKKVEGRTRLQKLVYLLKEKYGIKFSYRFMPYFYGPYSEDMQMDINMLTLLDLIRVETQSLREGVLLYIHSLSPNGEKIAEEIEKEISLDQKKQLQMALRELDSIPTEKLVEYAKELMKYKQT